jgi:hypothetical protein
LAEAVEIVLVPSIISIRGASITLVTHTDTAKTTVSAVHDMCLKDQTLHVRLGVAKVELVGETSKEAVTGVAAQVNSECLSGAAYRPRSFEMLVD